MLGNTHPYGHGTWAHMICLSSKQRDCLSSRGGNLLTDSLRSPAFALARQPLRYRGIINSALNNGQRPLPRAAAAESCATTAWTKPSRIGAAARHAGSRISPGPAPRCCPGRRRRCDMPLQRWMGSTKQLDRVPAYRAHRLRHRLATALLPQRLRMRRRRRVPGQLLLPPR